MVPHTAASLVAILLIQLAIPSELAGYVFGLIRCPVRAFAVALALAEIPYVLGAVFLWRGAFRLTSRILHHGHAILRVSPPSAAPRATASTAGWWRTLKTAPSCGRS